MLKSKVKIFNKVLTLTNKNVHTRGEKNEQEKDGQKLTTAKEVV
jgi:hypothetical protein